MSKHDNDGAAQPDFNDPDIEAEWIAEQRAIVTEYLAAQDVYFGEIGDLPAWHVPGAISIWAVESSKTPGFVGWWAFSGDIPTDYISSQEAKEPRSALRALAATWLDVCDHMERGVEHPDRSFGTPDQWPELVEMLRPRAETLRSWSKDGSLWKH